MSRNFPRWEDSEWDFQKGNLDEETKRYAARGAKFVRDHGGHIHFFAVGRVFEQPDLRWLEEIVKDGHPVGNHTYDHVNVLAKSEPEIQFRFRRAPWLIEGKTVAEVLEQNIHMTSAAIRTRLGVEPQGFRTPGGFVDGLSGRSDVQRMLLRAGFRWVSSRYGRHDAGVWTSIADQLGKSQPFAYPETGLYEIPMSPVSDINAFRTGRWKLERFLETTQRCVEWSIEHSAVFDLLLHPSCIGVVDPEQKTLELVCRLVRESRGKAVLATLGDIGGRQAG
ncbi:MAG: polysaccharide deacetylase family protein [Acidobacteria bacterium]|nr:polysaccharide deacetylase family protein [Acidobacteriota bacterium]